MWSAPCLWKVKGTQIIGDKKGKLKSKSPERPSKVKKQKGLQRNAKGNRCSRNGNRKEKTKGKTKGYIKYNFACEQHSVS